MWRLNIRPRRNRWIAIAFLSLLLLWSFVLFKNLTIDVKLDPSHLHLHSLSSEQIDHVSNQSELKPFENFLKENPVQYNFHIFYYPWYGNPQYDDGRYYHWNHRRLAHWNREKAVNYPQHRHEPPDDIGSNFYPALGPYSSRSPMVLEEHMKMIRMSGAGTLAVSWYPPGMADEEGHSWDDLIPRILDVAHRYQLKICFHMEPYQNRTAANLIQWSLYILREYGRHPAFYRYDDKGFFYVYDSYQIPTDQWRRYLVSSSSKMRRAFFVGLLLKSSDCSELSRAGFDAAYSYFAADGFTEASTSSKWSSISKQCQPLMFIPSIGPGYIDTNIRPWNGETTRLRRNGDYYRQMFNNLPEKTHQTIVSITSFNEWGEGTQIEAAAKSDPNKMITYESYHQGPLTYIKLTRELLFSR